MTAAQTLDVVYGLVTNMEVVMEGVCIVCSNNRVFQSCPYWHPYYIPYYVHYVDFCAKFSLRNEIRRKLISD